MSTVYTSNDINDTGSGNQESAKYLTVSSSTDRTMASSSVPSFSEVKYQITKEIHINYTIDEILKTFTKCAVNEGYSVMNSFTEELFLVDRSASSRFRRVLGCLWPGYSLPMLRCYVTTDEYRRVRILTVQGVNGTVSGEMDRVRLILERYESKLQSLPVEILEVEDIDEYEDIYSLIATSSYMFGKMLLEEKYSIGKKTLEFVRLIKPIAGHRIHKDDVRWIQEMRTEISNDMLRGFNCSRKQLNEILPYCRTIIEQFLYQRIYNEMFAGKAKTPTPEDLNDLADQYPQTVKDIVKFSAVLTPSLQILQIFRIITSFDHEYNKQERYLDKRTLLGKVVKSLKIPKLQERLALLRYYHEINGQCEVFSLFESACNCALKQ